MILNIRYFSMVHGVSVKDPPEGAYEVTTHSWSWCHHRTLTKPSLRYPSRALPQPFTSIMSSQYPSSHYKRLTEGNITTSTPDPSSALLPEPLPSWPLTFTSIIHSLKPLIVQKLNNLFCIYKLRVASYGGQQIRWKRRA